jgi:hypothetical protein
MTRAMRLSETITIYLAAGASFGVYDYHCGRLSGRRFHSLLQALHTMLLWPLVAVKILVSRQHTGKGKSVDAAERAHREFIEKIDRAHRDLAASLFKVIESTQVSNALERAKLERAACSAREAIEKYIGLTIAAAESSADAPASKRELELFRVAGRRGDDLLLAGRCIHRRNLARLITHQARARIELLHALADIREVAGSIVSDSNVASMRHLSVATVRFYSHAFNLLSLLEDETAAARIARLLDAECARLRRLESLGRKERDTAEEELCTAHHSHQKIFIKRSQTTALNQG